MVLPKNQIRLDKYRMITTSPVDGWMDCAGDLKNKATSARRVLTELGNRCFASTILKSFIFVLGTEIRLFCIFFTFGSSKFDFL